MNNLDFAGLLPILILAATSIIVLLLVAIRRNHFVAVFFTSLGLIVTVFSFWLPKPELPIRVANLLIIDSYAQFFMVLILAATFVVTTLAYQYQKNIQGNREEFYVVLVLATLGSVVLIASDHFVSFFLGLELLSVSLYVMIAYMRVSELSIEAGTKYLILAAASSAFLLFGMALIYAELGTMQLEAIASRIVSANGLVNLFILTGLALMIVGIGFKLAVVPFHVWTPDVYQGAPAPVTAYIATVSKGAMFALLLRFFYRIDGGAYSSMVIIFTVISVASMFVGNLLALLQNNVKRILAYSSIAHLGYMLVAFVAGGELAAEAIAFYLVAYFVTTLAAFGTIALLAKEGQEWTELDDFRGLFWSHPWVAAVFTAALLSLAGIPLTSGFIGKYFVVAAGVDSAQWLLVFMLVINSAISLYYYLRVVVAMLSQPDAERVTGRRITFAGGLLLAVLALALLGLGIYPTPLIQVIRSALIGFLS